MLKQVAGAVLVMFSTVAMANGTLGTVPKPWPMPPKPEVSVPVTNNNTAVGIGGEGGSATSIGTGGSVGNVSAGVQTGPVNAASQLNIKTEAAAYAPDVIAYPTAPCRVAFGASGGGITAVFGISGSVLDEACSRIETSRHLHNLGAKEAAVQIMCLSVEAKQALEATGVKCLIKPEPAPEPVKP